MTMTIQAPGIGDWGGRKGEREALWLGRARVRASLKESRADTVINGYGAVQCSAMQCSRCADADEMQVPSGQFMGGWGCVKQKVKVGRGKRGPQR
jgi:hypothetical protein